MKRALLFAALTMTLLLASIPARAADDHFEIRVTADNVVSWTADYLRDLPSGAGWTDGDRVGYKCAYAFLMNNGVPVGRVTFTRVVAAASYVKINDYQMVEGARHYDGTPANLGGGPQLNECPAPSQTYTAYAGPDQRPTITYEAGGCTVLETRSYPNIVAGTGIKFQQVESSDSRVTVVAYKNNLPIVVVYYDALGSTVMNSDL